MSTPIRAPRPTPTMIDIGVASPRAHGQAMMRTETATIRAWASFGSGPMSAHTANASTATADDGGHEPCRDLVGQPLDGCAGALGVGDHLHDAGQHGVAAYCVGTHRHRPGPVQGAADDAVAGVFADGHRLAGHHRLVHARAALVDGPVDRDLFAGPDPEPVAEVHLGERDVGLGAGVIDAVRCLRGQVEQRLGWHPRSAPGRAARVPARAAPGW